MMSSMVTRHKAAAAANNTEEKMEKRSAEDSVEPKGPKRRKQEDSDTGAVDVGADLTKGNEDNVMALLSKAQEAALTERVQKREQLKREHLKVQELDAKLANYKNRARKAEAELKTQKEEMEKAIAIQKEETEKATAKAKMLEEELKATTEAKALLEERLNTIVGLAHPGAPDSTNGSSGATVKMEPDTVPTSPEETKKDRKVWTDEEKRTLYNAVHETNKMDHGRINWKEIIKKIPGVSNVQACSKFEHATRKAGINSLEAAFVGEKVAKEDVERVGTVVKYDMDKETREGTWTVTFSDGKYEEMKSKELLEAWRRYKKE